MFVFSSLSRVVPLPDPPEEHPAASIVTATADAIDGRARSGGRVGPGDV